MSKQVAFIILFKNDEISIINVELLFALPLLEDNIPLAVSVEWNFCAILELRSNIP